MMSKSSSCDCPDPMTKRAFDTVHTEYSVQAQTSELRIILDRTRYYPKILVDDTMLFGSMGSDQLWHAPRPA